MDALLSLKNLMDLEANDNELTDKSALKLLSLTWLQKLALGNNHITTPTLATLRGKIKSVEAIRDNDNEDIKNTGFGDIISTPSPLDESLSVDKQPTTTDR